MVANHWCHEAAVLREPSPAPCLGNRAKCGVCIFKSAQRPLRDLCGRCYLSCSIHVLLLWCLGPGGGGVSGRLRKGRLGNFPRKISMMSNMAENLAEAHLGQRRRSGADGVDPGRAVWGGRKGRSSRGTGQGRPAGLGSARRCAKHACHHSPFVPTAPGERVVFL